MIGVLLINLGTPDSPKVSDVRKFLREFLSDPRVVDIPNPIRWLLLNTLILPFRPFRSAAAYQKIWTEKGSPLLINSQQLHNAVANKLGENFIVALGMRYGKPSIQSAMTTLLSHPCKKIIILPLFPQYSSAATGSVIQKVLESLTHQNNIPPIQFCDSFYHHPRYIGALASVIKNELHNDKSDLLLLSYHGLPERHIDHSQCHKDHCNRKEICPTINPHNQYCYRAQCYATSRLLAHAVGLKEDQYQVCFQSRLGRIPWITPYTDHLLPELAERGIKNLHIACPSFVADCLETLEEIGIRAAQQWVALGGESLKLMPCLNSHPRWVSAVSEIIQEHV